MKKKKLMTIAAIITIIIFILARYAVQTRPIAPLPVVVQTTKVAMSALPQEVQAVGALTARSVMITPELSGHIQKVLFTDGEFVKAGTVLIQLDDAINKSQLDSAKAQLAFSEHDFQRKSTLGKRGLVAKQDVDQSEANFKQKRAEVEEKQVMVSKMQLVAPFDGVVGKTTVNPGDYVTTNQPIVSLTDTHHLRVEYNVPEKVFPQLKLNQAVNVTTSTYPGQVFIGKIAYIAPTVNVDNRSISLYAELSNDKNLLASGMLVNITQSLGSDDQAIMVPARSLVPTAEGEQIYKVVNGKAEAVNVQVGKRVDNQAQILQGIAANDVVITDGQFKVKTGMPVNIKS
jgi:membrane fusion protein (multidrug efflux system)